VALKTVGGVRIIRLAGLPELGSGASAGELEPEILLCGEEDAGRCLAVERTRAGYVRSFLSPFMAVVMRLCGRRSPFVHGARGGVATGL